MKPKNIVVLMGGISSEREISLRSGSAVAKALEEVGFNVTCVGVKQLLESKGITYTVSEVNASKLAMDKLATKRCFVKSGLKTPDYLTITEFQDYDEIRNEVTKFGLPVVLKPTRNGSSIGISILKDINNLRICLEKAFEFGYEILVEKYIKGRSE